MRTICIILFCYFLLPIRILAQIETVKDVNGKEKGWNVMTQSGVYQLMLNDRGEVLPTFYGPRARAEQLLPQDRSRGNGPFSLHEVPVRGAFAEKIPIIEAIFPDNTRDIELVFEKAEIRNIDGRPTLCVLQRDRFYAFTVTSYIRPLPEWDIMEKWIEVKNEARKGAIKLENLLSASILLPANRYVLTHHGGKWFNEFQLQQTELTTGIKTMQARDFASFENTPWFAISPADQVDEAIKDVWFGQVHYSGNWRIDIESVLAGQVQVVGGINFWDTQWKLEPSQTFTSPRMSFGFTRKGIDEAARLYANYSRKEIMRPSMRDKIRPVIYNSWYATGFHVNEAGQLELAKQAKAIGAELFVIDDGWFAGRKDDRAGLGDWYTDTSKFPHGLNPLIKQVNDMGMQFGLWVEPEMVNPNSELYRKHPDWVLHFPNRKRNEWRSQLTLNLAREDVYTYLLQSMSELLSKHNIKFLKWDRNRGLSEPGWPSATSDQQREVRIRYMNNLYRLVDELEKRFPEVMFESCASGGGRPDFGMLSRMDQTWTSDNTHPLDRLYIQYGYLSAYPANTMVCWTTGYDRKTIDLSQEFIFDVAMQGVLGVGDNISQWNDKQKQTATKKIAEYKSIRHLVQQGNLYRLRSPFLTNNVALQYVAPTRDEAVVICYSLAKAMEGANAEGRASKQLILQGLDANTNYVLDDKNGTTLTGEYLMSIGIPWPVSGPYKSAIIKLKRK